MLKKQIASLLVCTVTLFSIALPNAFAQSFTQSEGEKIEYTLSATKAKPIPDFKTSLDGEMAKIKAESSTINFKRIQDNEQNPQPPAKSDPLRSKKFLVIFGIGMVALIVLLAVKGVDNPAPRCSEDPIIPGCI